MSHMGIFDKMLNRYILPKKLPNAASFSLTEQSRGQNYFLWSVNEKGQNSWAHEKILIIFRIQIYIDKKR